VSTTAIPGHVRTPSKRRILELKREGLSLTEIAQRCQVSRSAVSRRLSRKTRDRMLANDVRRL
jgi:IS30 family transposase